MSPKPRKGVETAREQVSGTADNLREFSGSVGLDDFLPKGLRDLIGEFLYLIPHALGRGTPRQQITSSVILLVLVVVSLPFSLPLTAGTILFVLGGLALTLGVGIYRMVPAINSAFNDSRAKDALSKNRDVPGWRRE